MNLVSGAGRSVGQLSVGGFHFAKLQRSHRHLSRTTVKGLAGRFGQLLLKLAFAVYRPIGAVGTSVRLAMVRGAQLNSRSL